MLSLALPGTSWAHRLPAGAKFGALAVLMPGLVALDDPMWLLAALVAVAALYATLGLRGLRAGGDALRQVLWVVGAILLWQIMTGRAFEGVVLGLRIMAMVGLATFVTLTTPLPALIALVEWLSRPLGWIGVSPRLPALGVAMALRFIPELRQRMEILGLAWRARARKRPGPRLIAPMALSLIDDSEHLAEAIRARGGLNPPRQP